MNFRDNFYTDQVISQFKLFQIENNVGAHAPKSVFGLT